MKIAKRVAIFSVIIFVGFLEWLNTTPGYFQTNGCCGIVYNHQKLPKACPPPCPHILLRQTNRLLVRLGNSLDFYK